MYKCLGRNISFISVEVRCSDLISVLHEKEAEKGDRHDTSRGKYLLSQAMFTKYADVDG